MMWRQMVNTYLRYGVVVGNNADSDMLVINPPEVNESLDEISLMIHVKVTVSTGVLNHEHNLSGVTGWGWHFGEIQGFAGHKY